MSRPPYGSHSGCRHACQKRPTSQCGWTRRAAAQTVVAQRVLGGARKALLRDRGNESLRRRLSEGAPPRDTHAGDGFITCFIVGGSSSRAETWLASALSVAKSGGKEVSYIEKNSDLIYKKCCVGFLKKRDRLVTGCTSSRKRYARLAALMRPHHVRSAKPLHAARRRGHRAHALPQPVHPLEDLQGCRKW